MTLPVAAAQLVPIMGPITPVEGIGDFGAKALVEGLPIRSDFVYCEPADRRLREAADEALVEARRELGIAWPLAVTFFADALAADGTPELEPSPGQELAPGRVQIADLRMGFFRPRLPHAIFIRLWSWSREELRSIVRHEVFHAHQLDEGRRLWSDSTDEERAAYEAEADAYAHTRPAPGIGAELSDATVIRATLGLLPGGDFGLAVYNPQSTVIIDGTSDVFKIVSTGTLAADYPTAAGTANSASVVLSALGDYTLVPPVHFWITENDTTAGFFRHEAIMLDFNLAGDGSLQRYGDCYAVLVSAPCPVTVEMDCWTVAAGFGSTSPGQCRYSVLAEAPL